MRLPVVRRPEARAEFDNAFDWYEQQRPGLGVYKVEPQQVVVLAVFHSSRDPKIWQARA